METIKVNMAPCDEVQTIHASQNDTEAREWEFELHNNGELIDTSEVTEQMFFMAYKGGTEQLLPENTSTPTTSPFLGNIKYPQGLLTDQEFTYRESPTESDGLAKITDVKGNTLVWNQLVQNGNFASTSIWALSGPVTFTVSNNKATVVCQQWQGIYQQIRAIANHKYLLIATCKQNGTSTAQMILREKDSSQATLKGTSENITNTERTLYVTKVAEATTSYIQVLFQNNGADEKIIEIKNVMLIDLTQMGLDITDPSGFASFFPLSYYSYNQGSLLSFNGNGIKTVSKNQFDTQVATTSYAGLVLTKTQGTIRAVYSGGSQYAGFNFYGSPVFTDTFLKGRYRLSFDVSGLDTQWTVGLRQGASFLGGGQALAISNDGHYSFTIDAEANPNCYLSFARTGNKTTAYDVTFSNIQLELGTTETPYTQYEEKTISLPISQYFPTGMKSAGNVYDELTESKAITRIGVVDLGTLNWYYTSGGQGRFASGGISSTTKHVTANTEVANIKNAKYSTISAGSVYNGNVGIAIDTSGAIWVYDTTYGTDASAFRTAISGVYLYYELATPTETSFTTASLVTENAEIPLSNEDGILIGKCTEQLSENPGFFDAKIKLSDSDGECYSNKIQLHVERSPQ